MPERRVPGDPAETAELRRLRRRIDALDRRIVALMSDRARLGLAVGAAKSAAGRRGVLDANREREVLLRVAMANPGPLPQSELLAVYRRLILATRRLEVSERRGGTARENGARELAATEPPEPEPQA
jgi:chorismate mutase/prephenate dehydratase